MTDHDLNEIESRIGRYGFNREEALRFQTFNPEADIQELVCEVRRLKTVIRGETRYQDVPKFCWLARVQEMEEHAKINAHLLAQQTDLARQAETERDRIKKELATSQDNLSVVMDLRDELQGKFKTRTNQLENQEALMRKQEKAKWNAVRKVQYLSDRNEELKKENKKLKKEKAELLNACHHNELIFRIDNPKMMEELETAQTARATAETERDELQAELAEAVAIIYSCGMIPCGLWKDSECCKPGKLRCFETCNKCIRTEIKHRM